MKPLDAITFDAGIARPVHATAPKRSWTSTLGWIVVIAVLGLSWSSADMRPLDLLGASGNMSQFARDFFRPTSRNGARMRMK